METVAEIISAMLTVAPRGQAELNSLTLQQLRTLTEVLLRTKTEVTEEYERFLQIKNRGMSLHLPDAEVWLRDKTVLVTGGTGCVGSSLIGQITKLFPRRVVCLSRSVSDRRAQQRKVEYYNVDIRDYKRLAAVFDEIRPEIVFHLAAQRDPGLAEQEVHETVTTNVFGTRNVIKAAIAAGTYQVVHASTGKAMRPYSSEVYTTSKRIAEWLAHLATGSGTSVAAARFTHVVDNSIIHERLQGTSGERFVRLHEPYIVFYGQSALESAQLLISAGLESTPHAFQVHAIADLGWPIGLLDLALGVLKRSRSVRPIYFSGYDKGYGDTVWPGLHDPVSAGDVSPLLNIFEAARSVRTSRQTDMFELAVGASPVLEEDLLELERVCYSTRDADLIRKVLDSMSRTLLNATLEVTSPQVIQRSAKLAAPYHEYLNTDCGIFLEEVRRRTSQFA